MTAARAPLSERDLKLVAAEAGIDPRTVHRVVVEREPPRSEATRSAVVKALRKYGHREIADKVEGGK